MVWLAVIVLVIIYVLGCIAALYAYTENGRKGSS